MFYASDPRRLDLVEYEEKLGENLADLIRRLEGDDEDWVREPAFIGGFTFEPKAVARPDGDGTTFWSAPARAWRNSASQASEPPIAQFRLMARCSIAMHVFTTLWMLEVGTYLDGRLGDNAHGNRIRRSPEGGPNQLGTGTFLPYQPGYQRWRDGGIDAMRRALSEAKDVIALTADVTAFYHHLDPSFIQDEAFLSDVLDIELTPEQAKLNRLFVSALKAWANEVAIETGWRSRGLPVGLPASAVVANLALVELDSVIDESQPLYYGRYVDDILLVVEGSGDIHDQQALWRWLVDRSRGLLTADPMPSALKIGISQTAIRFVPAISKRP